MYLRTHLGEKASGSSPPWPWTSVSAKHGAKAEDSTLDTLSPIPRRCPAAFIVSAFCLPGMVRCNFFFLSSILFLRHLFRLLPPLWFPGDIISAHWILLKILQESKTRFSFISCRFDVSFILLFCDTLEFTCALYRVVRMLVEWERPSLQSY